MEAARLFWAFERAGPDIVPCGQCQPRGAEVPDIPDGDRELYDWMMLGRWTIANMDALVRNFAAAYAEGGRLT